MQTYVANGGTNQQLLSELYKEPPELRRTGVEAGYASSLIF
ncbi:hypothetical protein [Spirosoma liriopis]|nr:hypothetical protein [Spirosoma liriopis]